MKPTDHQPILTTQGTLPNRISAELLKVSFRLEEMGLKDDASSKLAVLADLIAKDDRLPTVVEAADWIGCGRRSFDQMVSERKIPAHLISGCYRFDKAEVLHAPKLKG